MAFSIFTTLCNHHHYIIPGPFHQPPRKCYTYELSLPFSPSSSPWQPLICFLSLWICLLWVLPTNGLTIRGLLCLTFFTQHNVFQVRLRHSTHPNSTPFYWQIIVYCTSLPLLSIPPWWTLALSPLFGSHWLFHLILNRGSLEKNRAGTILSTRDGNWG